MVQHLKQAGVDVGLLGQAFEMYVDDMYNLVQVDFDQYDDPMAYYQVLDYVNVLEAILPYLKSSK
ncbi:MAG: hypothetical protein EAZ80_01650 [Runella slithyformis]|nr:MAG: hypothetical protein EAZ80_01650 [Runella slithyformis]TAF48667.1 MAG: hypothetical protein EAZ63_03705 [Runella slithyformis]